MKLRTRVWMWACAVLVCVATFAAILLVGGPSVVALDDGGEVRLVRLTYGTNDQMVFADGWRRWAVRFVPARAVKRFGAQAVKLQSSNETLFAWIEVRQPLRPPAAYMASFLDDDGLESTRYGPVRSTGSTNGTTMVVFKGDVFPRRARSLTIGVYQGQTNIWRRIAQWKLPNPGRSQVATWKDEPLPQVRRQGTQEFELLQFRTGLTATGQVEKTFGSSAWSELVFRIGTNEPCRFGTNALLAGGWKVRTVECNDATGNQIVDRSPLGRIVFQNATQAFWRGDDGVVSLRGAFWPEDAWKVRVTFEQTSSAEPLEENIVVVRDIPIPRPGETNELKRMQPVGGALVFLDSISTSETNVFTATNAFAHSRTLSIIRAQFIPTVQREELRLMQAFDERGSNVLRMATLPGQPLSQFRLAPLRDSTSVNLTLGVKRAYAVEFVAKPTVLRTNLDHWPRKE